MQRITRLFKILVVMLSALAFLSCAAVPVEDIPELYWPMPPQKPKIKFLDLILGSLDVTGVRAGKFENVLFGTEKDIKLIKPSYIAVNNNVVFVTDGKYVHMYDFNEKTYGVVGRGNIIHATGIAVTSDGTLYVGDSGRKVVYIFERGASKVRALKGKFISPGGIAVDENNGRVYVVDAKRHNVGVYTLEGEFIYEIGKRGGKSGKFNFPYDVAVDNEGRIYVLDSGNFRVQIFDPEGNFINKFGAVGTAPGHFSRPKGIALDSEGHIYVVDAAFGNYQIFNDKGAVFLAVGASGKDPGMFLLPFGIDIDENDRVYVVDQMNMRIQVFQYIK
jgi:DNA-binding beta-propeller fold protein YncE